MSLSPALASPVAPPVTDPQRALPRWAGLVMILVFALVMPVGYAGNEGEAVVATLGGLAALPFVLRLRRPSLGVVLLAALAVWAAATFAWSPLLPNLANAHQYKDYEALTAPKLLLQLVLYSAFVFGALRLAADQRDRALLVLAALLAVVVGLLLIEGVEGGQLYGTLNHLFGHHHQALRPDLARRDAARGCYPVALLFWPAALSTSRRVPQWAAVLVVLGLLVSAAMLGVDSPIAALAVSLLVFVGVQRFPRTAPVVLAVGVVIYFLIAPLPFLSHETATAAALPGDIGKESWHIRIDIWRFASRLIAHRPLLGYGLDASRVYPDQIPMHPHDAAIQLWLETGVLGALLAGLFWGWLFLRIRAVGRADATWTAAACGTASAYLLIGAVSFGVWQEWWLALGAVAVAACGMVLQQRHTAVAEETAAGGLTSLS